MRRCLFFRAAFIAVVIDYCELRCQSAALASYVTLRLLDTKMLILAYATLIFSLLTLCWRLFADDDDAQRAMI